MKEWKKETTSQWVKSLGSSFIKFADKFIALGIDGNILLACIEDDSILDIIFEIVPLKKIFLLQLKAEIDRRGQENASSAAILELKNSDDFDKLMAKPMSTWNSITVMHWLSTHPVIKNHLTKDDIQKVFNLINQLIIFFIHID